MNPGLPLLSRHSEMLGRAVGTMPSHQVGPGKKSTCRRNQNNEGTLPLRSIDVANAAIRFAESSLSFQEFLLVRRHRTARLFGRAPSSDFAHLTASKPFQTNWSGKLDGTNTEMPRPSLDRVQAAPFSGHR